jgi:hypothetical protein
VEAVNPDEALEPVVVGPGQTTTIPVTITPEGSAGSVVSGTLYVDDLTSIAGAATWNTLANNVNQGSDLAALPYEYKIGAS